MSSAVALKTWEGRTVDGKFLLRQWLGGSDHGAVFVTERQEQPQKAAIKLIAADGADADRQLSQWREAARLSHPHLVRIFETGRCQLDGTGLLYVVMEYAEEDLSQILPQRALTPAEAYDLLPPLLDAVAFLHGNGFVHGGLKPSNILAVGDHLKLASDHIAPALEGNSGRRRRDMYDAPETALGVVSRAGDIWSLGATLVATLMQSARFSEDASQRDADLPPTMPEPFRGIARECLHFDPKRRSSIAEIMARLEPAGRSVSAAEPEAPPKPSVRARHDRHTWRMLIPIGILLLFALGVRLFMRSATPKVAGLESPKGLAATREPAVTPNPTPVTASRAGASSNGEVVKQVLPDIPQSAKNTIWGTVKIAVRVEVDSSGKVTEAKLTSRGPSQYFASRALEAAQHWEFAPPTVDGQPTPSIWVVHFRLRRSSMQISAERLRRS